MYALTVELNSPSRREKANSWRSSKFQINVAYNRKIENVTHVKASHAAPTSPNDRSYRGRNVGRLSCSSPTLGRWADATYRSSLAVWIVPQAHKFELAPILTEHTVRYFWTRLMIQWWLAYPWLGYVTSLMCVEPCEPIIGVLQLARLMKFEKRHGSNIKKKLFLQEIRNGHAAYVARPNACLHRASKERMSGS